MSRPFSYNDNNFTLIGNILFYHIKINKVISHDNIVEIPPEIYKRMLYKSTNMLIVSTKDNDSTALRVNAGVRKSSHNGRYYLFTDSEINRIGFYLTGCFVLKDI